MISESPFPLAEESLIPLRGGVAEGRLFHTPERRPFFV
jgi:hypothetical protein